MNAVSMWVLLLPVTVGRLPTRPDERAPALQPGRPLPEYDVLLAGYVSRFARNLRAAVNARHGLHEAGTAVLFCNERVLSSVDRGRVGGMGARNCRGRGIWR